MANKAPVLSPHVQIWGWTVTMAASILHRATGVGLYTGTILLTVWLASAAMGPEAYVKVMAFLHTPVGAFILFGYSWAICYHLLGGIRFLFWDAGYGFSKQIATKSAWGIIAGSLILTAAIWGSALAMSGGH